MRMKSARQLKTSLNIQIKKLEASSSTVKTQQFVVSDFGKENTTLIICNGNDRKQRIQATPSPL